MAGLLKIKQTQLLGLVCKSLKVAEPEVSQVVRREVLTLRMVGNRFNGPVMGHSAQLKAPQMPSLTKYVNICFPSSDFSTNFLPIMLIAMA